MASAKGGDGRRPNLSDYDLELIGASANSALFFARDSSLESMFAKGSTVDSDQISGSTPEQDEQFKTNIQMMAMRGMTMFPPNAKLTKLHTMRFPNSPMSAVMFEVEQSREAKSISLPLQQLDDFNDYWVHPVFDPIKATKENLNEHARQCFECILRVPGRDVKKELMTALLKDKDFLTPKGYHNVVRQYHFACCIMFLQYSHSAVLRYTLEFPKGLDFQEFLIECGAVEALFCLAEHKPPVILSTDEHQEPPWHWESVPSLALLAMQFFLHLHRRESTKTIPSGDVARIEKMVDYILQAGYIPMMLRILATQEGEFIRLSRCLSELKHIGSVADRAHPHMIKANGVEILIPYFAPGLLEDKLKELRKTGFHRATKLLLSQGIHSFEPKDARELTEDDFIQRAERHIEGMHEMAGSLIAWMAEISDAAREFCLAPGAQTSVVTAIRWLNRPMSQVTFQKGTVKAASEIILAILSGSHHIAHKFIERYDLRVLLRLWLLSPVCWPIYDLLSSVKSILDQQTGHCNCFGYLADVKELVEASVLYLYTKNTLIQAMAYCVVVLFVQQSPTIAKHIVKLDCISPKLLEEKIGPMCDMAPDLTEMIAARLERWCGDLWKLKDKRMEAALRDIGGQNTKKLSREDMKQRGNDAFHNDHLGLAIKWYSAALLAPGEFDMFCCTVLSNRAECYLRQGSYLKTIRDATRAIAYDFELRGDPTILKALFRRAKALFHLGRFFEAHNDIARCVRESALDKFAAFRDEVFDTWQANRPNVEKTLAEKTKELHQSGVCTNCGHSEGGMKQCARCVTNYCSRVCQQQHWQLHKYVCGQITAARPPPSGESTADSKARANKTPATSNKDKRGRKDRR